MLTSPEGQVRIHTDKPARPIVEYLPAEGAETPQRLTTRGGELAAFARCRVGGVVCCAAGIAGVRFTLVKGMCDRSDADTFVTDFKQLVTSLDTGDDPLRRRMFVYQPPAGWRGRRLAFSSRWYPPGCPRDREFFEVFDAVPLADHFGLRTFELAVDRAGPKRISVQTDESFRYELHHVDPEDRRRHDAAFARTVESLEHLPAPWSGSESAGEELSWLL